VTSEPVAVGSKVAVNGKDVGEITSSTTVTIQGVDRHVALGYIRREVGTPGREVSVGTVKAIVASTPLSEAVLLQQDLSLAQRPA
jgi:glycine cleavage system aminomethyltransferase T